MSAISPRLTDQRGSAMIEFALVLPILLFLILGIVDFGKAINYWNDTNQLAADGARFAAVNNNPGDPDKDGTPDFRDWIRLQAETGELQSGRLLKGTPGESESPSTYSRVLKVCVDAPAGRTVGSPIKVTVSTAYNLIPLLGNETSIGRVAINGEAVMRLEQAYTGPVGCDETL